VNDCLNRVMCFHGRMNGFHGRVMCCYQGRVEGQANPFVDYLQPPAAKFQHF
jgi:hypothetical protein